MRICLITSSYALSERDPNVPFLTESVTHLVNQGAEVHVFAPSYEGRGSHVLNGVPVYRFRYFFRRWENLTHRQGAPNRIRNPFYIFVAFFYILFGLFHAIHFCRKNRFDIIHVHWPFPHGIWGYAASRLSGTPMVLTFYAAELLLCKKFFFVKYFLKHAIKHSKAIISISSFTTNEVEKLTDKPIEMVPYGCTITPRPAVKTAKPVKDILFAGRLIARKGVDYLLQALPLIDADQRVHLHIVGDGDKAAAWKALAADLKLDSKVTFHGFVSKDELQRQYANADVFVLPAIVDERGDTEGLGVVLVEALSFKTPVVASNVGGIPDVIKDGETGLLVPEKDPAALAAAIVKLLRDRHLADALGTRGLRYATSYFDWKRITESLMQVYQSVLPLEVAESQKLNRIMAARTGVHSR